MMFYSTFTATRLVLIIVFSDHEKSGYGTTCYLQHEYYDRGDCIHSDSPNTPLVLFGVNIIFRRTLTILPTQQLLL